MRLDLDTPPVFQENTLPDDARLAGWAALVHALGIAAPVRLPACVSVHHVKGSQRREDDWLVFDKRYWPGETLADHLTFALRHESLDLLILKRAFDAVPQNAIEAIVRAAPSR